MAEGPRERAPVVEKVLEDSDRRGRGRRDGGLPLAEQPQEQAPVGKKVWESGDGR